MCQEVRNTIKESDHITFEIDRYQKLKGEKDMVTKVHRLNLRKSIMYKIIRFNRLAGFPVFNLTDWH